MQSTLMRSGHWTRYSCQIKYILYYSLSVVLVNLDIVSSVFVIVCFYGSLLTAGSMVSSYVRTAKFILSSSHTELSLRRYRISKPVCQSTHIKTVQPYFYSVLVFLLQGERSISVCNQRDNKEYVGLWVDHREDQRRRGT